MSMISVIMGVYRPDRMQLDTAIESIFRQTVEDWELIICEDGSEDGSWEYLKGWADRDSRLRLLRHERNLGLAAALNSCLEVARGEYIARQDADDYSLPERLEMQVAFLERYPQYACAGSAIQLWDGNAVWAVKRFPSAPLPEDFLFAIPFLHGALLFRAEALRACKGYHVSRITRRTEDYELMMRFYANGYRGCNLQEALYRYREDRHASAKRLYRHRLDEAIVRAQGFQALGLYPIALPYVVKPLLVGLIPKPLLTRLKAKFYHLNLVGK